MTWTIVDHTGKNGGYLQLQHDGERIADFFPFAAKGAGEAVIREYAKFIAAVLNDPPAAERARCAEIARSMGHDHCADAIEMGALVMPVEATTYSAPHAHARTEEAAGSE